MSSPQHVSPVPAAAADWLEALPVAVATVQADGRVAWANAAASALLPALRPGATLRDAVGLKPDTVAAAALGEIRFAHAGRGFAATARTAPDGRLLLTLRALETAPPPDDPRTLLEMACSAGRLGRFERDLRTGRGRWNRAMFTMRGLDGQDGEAPLIGEVDASVVAGDREAYVAWIRDTLSRPGRHRFRYHVRTPAGTVRALLCECVVVAGPDGRAERAFGFEADETVTSSLAPGHDSALAQVAMAADLTGIIVWRHELETDRAFYSPRATPTLGLPPAPDGVPADRLRALVHPGDLPKLRLQTREMVDTGRTLDAELRCRRVDGSGDWRTLLVRRAVERDADGRPIAVIGVSMDVTERVDESRRAAELGRRFELATRAAGIGYWSGTPDSPSLDWNDQLRAMHGLAPDEAVPGTDVWLEEFVHPDDRERARRAVGAWRRGHRGRLEIDLRIVRRDGSVRELSLHGHIDPREDGSRFGLILDVTDRRAAEQARLERELALSESQAKSRFLSRMSHELRTPLNAVIGFTDLLLLECAGADATRRRRLQSVRTAGAQLLALVDDVLEVTALEGGELRVGCERVELAPVVAQTLELVEPLRAAHGVRIEVDPADGAVLGDPLRLRQVLQNLLTNAIKYNRRGGRVEVAVRREADGTLLSVRDTGRGMDPQQMGGLFVPFNRLGAEREAIPGTGIGLVIVKGLVERMGGTIAIASTPGSGTVVELRLPSADAAEPPAAPAGPAGEAAPPAAGGRGAMLLYIEDNPVNAQILVEFIARRSDLRIEVVDTGAAGVRRAAELQPQVILLDMQLPDIDGHEVLRRLRADPRTAAIPVVALSANAMSQDISAALAAGMAGYWTKPLDFRAFLASLDTLIDATAS